MFLQDLHHLGHSIILFEGLKQMGHTTVYIFTKPEIVGSTYVKFSPQTGLQTKRANNVCETICAKAFLTLHHE